jgi:RNA polymerase sigma factor (sigma-70 family)
MKIAPEPTLIAQARSGSLMALNELLRQIQAPIYNVAVRMLGSRADAQDATQEILLKVTTHLATWREESAFGTWVLSVAGHHLLNSKSRSPARREISFESLRDALDKGLAYGASTEIEAASLTPADKLQARQLALSCTQAMLSALDAPGRLAYVLDVIFGLESTEAAKVQAIGAAAHRQRLARAKQALHGFMAERCGLVSSDAACRCAKQLPAKRAAAGRAANAMAAHVDELDAAATGLRELVQMSDAAAVLRGAPEYKTPEAVLQGIRLVVEQSRFLRQ